MKTLLVVRHAKSSWKDLNLPDHDRPLKKRGKQDAPRMGRLLYDEDLVPDLIISSTALRARWTAELVAEECGYEGEIVLTRDFYHADPEDYLMGLSNVPDHHGRVMIVGHNPGMQELLWDLTGESVRFTTANIAHIELPISSWRALEEEIEGKLIEVWRPKEL